MGQLGRIIIAVSLVSLCHPLALQDHCEVLEEGPLSSYIFCRGSSTWGASDDEEAEERPKPQKQASPMRQPSSVFEDNHAKLKSKGAYGTALLQPTHAVSL